MNNAYSINPKRLILLIRSYIFINLNLILVLTAVFSALTILDAFADPFFENSPDLYRANYFILLFISGFIITRRIGIDLHDIRKGSTWLLLPASIVEKFLTLFLLPTLILICGAALYMTVVSAVLEPAIHIFISSSHRIFNPFDPVFFKTLNLYIALQAPFLLGVIYFKKRGMSHTFLSLFIYSVILLIFAGLTGTYLLGDYLEPVKTFSDTMDNESRIFALSMIEKCMQVDSVWRPIISFFFYYVFPPVCWITAFFTLKEMEL